MRTLDNIDQLDDVGMFQCFQEMVLALDFDGFDRHQHFDGYLLVIFDVAALEDMGVATSSDFVRDCVLLKFSVWGERYPQGSSILS